MKEIDDFFIPDNEIRLPEELDYSRVSEFKSSERLYLVKSFKWLVLLFCLVIASCDHTQTERLDEAMSIVSERPDSAYVLLKGIDYNKLHSDKDKADYTLSHALSNLYLGQSLLTDSLLPTAINYYNSVNDTSAIVDASIAQAYHLRSVDENDKAWGLLDSLSAIMPKNIKRRINQDLLGFSFYDKDFNKSLDIIERQIRLSDNGEERFNFELKKITPLVSLGRNRDAIALCDSLFSIADCPKEGTREWLALRINYAAALGESRETSRQAAEILADILKRMGDAPTRSLLEFYIPMVNLQLNAGNINEACKYAEIIDNSGINIAESDAIAASYFDFLKIVLGYEQNGVLSLSRISNVAQSLRKVSNDLETKRQERDNALESAYDLSRNNYELTIKHQWMLLIIVVIVLSSIIGVRAFIFISQRRLRKLIDAEERIEALEGLLRSVENSTSYKNQELLKKLLLQQLGIIKVFVESPSSQNQETLRKISNIGNPGTPIDSLVKWEDLYPVMDELYAGFHKKLLRTYPDLFTEREIQILSLMRAEFSTKEIGVLLQLTSNSIYVAKTAIRKKLGLQQKEDFMVYLSGQLGAE